MDYQRFHEYDRFPAIRLEGGSVRAFRGWDAVTAELRRRAAGPRHVLVCELYPGVDRKGMLEHLTLHSTSVIYLLHHTHIHLFPETWHS